MCLWKWFLVRKCLSYLRHMSFMASQITGTRLLDQQIVQTNNKTTPKCRHNWTFVREAHRSPIGFPSQRASDIMTSSCSVGSGWWPIAANCVYVCYIACVWVHGTGKWGPANQESSWCQLCCQRRHRRLSLWILMTTAGTISGDKVGITTTLDFQWLFF